MIKILLIHIAIFGSVRYNTYNNEKKGIRI